MDSYLLWHLETSSRRLSLSQSESPASHPSVTSLFQKRWRHRVTCLPPKNASASWGGPGSRWLTIIIRQVSYIQYLLACQKSQRSTPYNIVKSGLAWSRICRRRHLGRRVTPVTCLRWPTAYATVGAVLHVPYRSFKPVKTDFKMFM